MLVAPLATGLHRRPAAWQCPAKGQRRIVAACSSKTLYPYNFIDIASFCLSSFDRPFDVHHLITAVSVQAHPLV